MALTTPSEGNKVEQWSANFFVDYVRGNQFGQDMGRNENAIIQRVMDLATRPGHVVTQSVVRKIGGDGVIGNETLEGNEVAQANFDHKVMIEQRRQGVVRSDADQFKTIIPLLNAARPALQNWVLDKTRDGVIAALGSVEGQGQDWPLFNGTPYVNADAARKTAWHDANSVAPYTRVLYGDAVANAVGGDHAASLANITASMTLSKGLVRLAKRLAEKAQPPLRPSMVKNTKTGAIEEWYKLYVPSEAFRDLEDAMDQTYEQAAARGRNNPIFKDDDIILNGIIVRKIPEMPTIPGVGNGGIDVAQCFLVGAQAVLAAYGASTRAISDNRDYSDKKGVGVREVIGYSKPTFDRGDGTEVDHGVFTLFCAGVADA